jgi:hypothetical protein
MFLSRILGCRGSKKDRGRNTTTPSGDPFSASDSPPPSSLETDRRKSASFWRRFSSAHYSRASTAASSQVSASALAYPPTTPTLIKPDIDNSESSSSEQQSFQPVEKLELPNLGETHTLESLLLSYPDSEDPAPTVDRLRQQQQTQAAVPVMTETNPAASPPPPPVQPQVVPTKSGTASVSQSLSPEEMAALNKSYESIPLLDVVRLPRGGLSVDTKAVGRVQVRILLHRVIHGSSRLSSNSTSFFFFAVWNSSRNYQR